MNRLMQWSLMSAAILLFGGVTISAQGLKFDLGLDQPTREAGRSGTAFLKIGLVGEADAKRQRPTLNVAIVLDHSGSMEGEKLRRAKEAAAYAVNLLKSEDLLSLVVFDSEVQVLVPAGKVGDRSRYLRAIERITAGSSTALFGGVSKGAAEIRKNLTKNQVNRVILLSDGIANVGPDSPAALGDLGASLRREGMSVTTIGLGTDYAEDLMSRLAMASDGNHAFVREPRDLVKIFDAEFRDAFSIAAVDIRIRIECLPGIVPKRILNREGSIRGQVVEVGMNQVLGSQEKYLLLEVELPPGTNGQILELAKASATYRNLSTNRDEQKNASGSVRFTNDAQLAKASVSKDVKEKVVLQLATEANEEAVRLRDEGKIDEAKKKLEANVDLLSREAQTLQSPALSGAAEQNRAAAAGIDKSDDEWNKDRKQMRQDQYQNKTQQSY